MEQSIWEKVVALFVSECGLQTDDISRESVLVTDLGLNSLDFMNIISALEETFSIRISEKELRRIVTMNDLLTCIASKCEGTL